MKRNLEKEILTLLTEKEYGLSIEEIAEFLHINRATSAKYLFAMESSEIIAARPSLRSSPDIFTSPFFPLFFLCPP